ncbi:MAG TPA: PQQ-binding-like beta-propeller repeat protein, partial [Pirellulales bacterium]|nr:PQQ-binding-like beta-propeller repeat protein [Pirellulales bacterium]
PAAAIDALVGLVDRELARGAARAAERRYRAAQRISVDRPTTEIGLRLRLAAAMLGLDVGEPADERVRLGDSVLEPEAFEAMLASLRGSAVAAQSNGERPFRDAFRMPVAPAAFRGANWQTIAPAPLLRTESRANRKPAPTPLPPMLAIKSAGAVSIINDGQILACYDAEAAKLRWRITAPDAPANVVASASMPPIVRRSRVFARRLRSEGAQIVAVDLNDGRLLWETSPQQMIVTDPLAVGDELLVVIAEPAQQETTQLVLARLDSQTGDIVHRAPLVQLRDQWQRRVPASAVLTDDTFVLVAGGCVLAASTDGTVHWLRRQIWIGGVVEHRDLARMLPPVVFDGSVVVQQPGVPSIACIDVARGWVRWQRVAPEVLRTFAIDAATVGLQMPQHLIACDVASDTERWRYASGRSPELMAAGDGSILFATRDPPTKAPRAWLNWLDAATGRAIAAASIATPDETNSPVRIDSIVGASDHPFMIGHATTDSKAMVAAPLVARGQAASADTESQVPHAWLPPLAGNLGDPFAAMDGWVLVASEADHATGPQATNDPGSVYVTLASPERPTRWMRHLAIPADTNAKLNIAFQNAADEPCTIDIEVAGQRRFEQVFKASESAAEPNMLEVDLSPFRGKSAWIVVTARSADRGKAHVVWQRMDIVEQRP